MASINKVILVGNVGKKPEIRYMANGIGVATFNLATSEKWKDKQTGDLREKTEWHKIVAYDPQSKVIEQYVDTGSQLYIEGKLQTRKYQDKNGSDRYTTEIIVQTVQMLGSKNASQQSQPAQQQSGGRNSYQDARDGRSNGHPTNNDFDDDIPF